MTRRAANMAGRVTRSLSIGIVAILLAACEPVPVDPEQAARDCEERARASQGPTGSVTTGINSQTGVFTGVQIGITSDVLRGSDPQDVYTDCVFELTGQAPFRPPEL